MHRKFKKDSIWIYRGRRLKLQNRNFFLELFCKLCMFLTINYTIRTEKKRIIVLSIFYDWFDVLHLVFKLPKVVRDIKILCIFFNLTILWNFFNLKMLWNFYNKMGETACKYYNYVKRFMFFMLYNLWLLCFLPGFKCIYHKM